MAPAMSTGAGGAGTLSSSPGGVVAAALQLFVAENATTSALARHVDQQRQRDNNGDGGDSVTSVTHLSTIESVAASSYADDDENSERLLNAGGGGGSGVIGSGSGGVAAATKVARVDNNASGGNSSVLAADVSSMSNDDIVREQRDAQERMALYLADINQRIRDVNENAAVVPTRSTAGAGDNLLNAVALSDSDSMHRGGDDASSSDDNGVGGGARVPDATAPVDDGGAGAGAGAGGDSGFRLWIERAQYRQAEVIDELMAKNEALRDSLAKAHQAETDATMRFMLQADANVELQAKLDETNAALARRLANTDEHAAEAHEVALRCAELVAQNTQLVAVLNEREIALKREAQLHRENSNAIQAKYQAAVADVKAEAAAVHADLQQQLRDANDRLHAAEVAAGARVAEQRALTDEKRSLTVTIGRLEAQIAAQRASLERHEERAREERAALAQAQAQLARDAEALNRSVSSNAAYRQLCKSLVRAVDTFDTGMLDAERGEQRGGDDGGSESDDGGSDSSVGGDGIDDSDDETVRDRCDRALSRYDAILVAYRTKLKQCTADCTTAVGELAQSEAHCAHMEAQLRMAEAATADDATAKRELRAQLTGAEESVDALKKQLALSGAQREQLQAQCVELQTVMVELHSVEAQLTDVNGALRVELMEAQDECALLREEAKRHVRAVNAQMEEIGALRGELAGLRVERDRLEHTINANAVTVAHVKTLGLSLGQKDRAVAEAQHRTAFVENKVEALKLALTATKADNDALRTRGQGMVAELEARAAELAATIGSLKEARADRDVCAHEKARLESRVRSLELSHSEGVAELKIARAKLLQWERRNSTGSAVEARGELERLAAANEALRGELDALHRQRGEAIAVQAQSDVQLKLAEKRAVAAEEQLRGCQRDAAIVGDACDAHVTKIARLESQLDELRGLEASNATLRTSLADVESVMQYAGKLERQNGALTAKHRAKRDALSALKRELRSAQSERDMLAREAQVLRQSQRHRR